jgi:hypothetical protein
MSTKFIYPNVEPTLRADFANSKRIPPEFQYSRASTGTYVGSDGLIKTAVAGQPRFDCDPLTGDVKGLLVEEARTNYRSYSSIPTVEYTSFQNRVTIVDAQHLAPDGTASAISIANNTGVDDQYCWSYFTDFASIPTTGYICASIFVKMISGNQIEVKGDVSNQGWIGFAGVRVNFSTSIPTVTLLGASGQNAIYGGVIPYPNNWWRVWFVVNTANGFNSGVTRGPGVVPRIAGTSAYIWGAQIEAGLFPTSYIPTTTTAVTRAADILTVPTSTFLNTSKSSIVVESETINPEASIISLNDGTTFNETKLIVYPTAGVSKLVTNDIVRSGLVLNLDAGNPASYPGSGTTWTDLSGNGNNGTLVNGVGYNSGNLGSLSFDGVNDRVSTDFKPSGSRSYFIWVKYNSVNSLPNGFSLTGTQQINAYNYIGIQNGGAFYYFMGTVGGTISSTVLSPNIWYQQGVVLFPDGSRKAYLNGIEIFSGTGGVGGTATNEFSVGAVNQNHWVNGFIPIVTQYNRALTAQEIQQNFNATKSRYI